MPVSDPSRYPILVARWDAKHPSDLAICTRCGYERTWDPSEGDPYDLCIKHEAKLENGCHGQIVMKYDAGETCSNCGKLDYSMPKGLDGCCSRRCMLQAEYAKELRHEGYAYADALLAEIARLKADTARIRRYAISKHGTHYWTGRRWRERERRQESA